MRIYRNLFLFLIVIQLIANNKNKASSKLDRYYRDCSNTTCKLRKHDEACILHCVNEICFREVYQKYFEETGYFLEFGELNQILKSKFDNCFYGRNY